MGDNLQIPVKGERPKVEWARAVVEAIVAGRTSGSGDVQAAKDPTGCTISRKSKWPTPAEHPEPMPFDVAEFYDSSEDKLKLHVYLPDWPASYEIVTRNGRSVSPVIPIDFEGWTPLAAFGIADLPIYLVIDEPRDLPGTTWPAGVDAVWSLSSAPPYADPRRTSLLIAREGPDGQIVQYRRGVIDTYYTMPDSEYTPDAFDCLSLDYTVGRSLLQLYHFDRGQRLGAVDLSSTHSEGKNPDKCLNFVVRYTDDPDDGYRVDYVTLEQIFDEYAARQDESADDFLDWLENWFLEVWSEWPDKIYEETDRRYWKLGGDNGNCYGNSIGDANQRRVIDLNYGVLIDGNEGARVEWITGYLYSHAKVALDWEDGVLVDNSGTIETPSLEWCSRWLHGDWVVQPGGSFDTPELKLDGQKVKTVTETINGTPYTFLVI